MVRAGAPSASITIAPCVITTATSLVCQCNGTVNFTGNRPKKAYGPSCGSPRTTAPNAPGGSASFGFQASCGGLRTGKVETASIASIIIVPISSSPWRDVRLRA